MIVAFPLIALIAVVLYLHDRERKRWEQERHLLILRVQAPEIANAKELEVEGPQYVPVDDDEAYWAYRDEVSA